MTSGHKSTPEDRITGLKGDNRELKKKLADLKKENRLLQKALRDSAKLFSQMPGGVVLIQDGRIVLSNEVVRRQLGYPGEDIPDRNCLEFVHPDSVGFLKDLHKKRLSGKSVPDQYEFHMVTKDGDKLCFEARVKKTLYKGKRAFLVNMIGLDQRKETEKQISRSEKREAIVRMAAGVSHAFDDCMTVLGENMLHLKSMPSPQDAALLELQGKAEGARQKGECISRQLNILAGIEHDPSHAVLFDLKKTVLDAVAISRSRWSKDPEGGGVKINVRTYLRTLSPVEGYPDEIRDVLADMILNAADAFKDDGEIYLTTEENSGYAHVYIQDNGEGIPDGIKSRIFDPFFTTRNKDRKGLGLSLAYAVIDSHGGEIEVISEEGRGATFIVKLPLARKKRLPGRGKTRKRIGDSSVLIVAKRGIIRDLLPQLLMSKGGRATVASSRPECLKALRKGKFDMVVVDLDGPDPELSKIVPRLSQMERNLPVIQVNVDGGAFSTPASKKKGSSHLAVGRPLDMDKLLSLVRQVLANGRV